MEAALLLLLCWGLASASAQEDDDMMNNKVSLSPPSPLLLMVNIFQYERQRYDGWYNNLAHPSWGTVDSHLVRKTPPSYADGVYMMSGGDRSVTLLECGVTTI